MSALSTSELYAAMRQCLAAPDGPGATYILEAVMREMRLVRSMPADGVRSDDRHSRAAAGAIRDLRSGLPGFTALLAADDCLGRISQALNEPALAAAYRATARTGRKFKPAEIPAVTQLFTPDWVVCFLLHNTLGRAWLEIHPDTGIALEWLSRHVSGGLGPRNDAPLPARALKILDPACGTMNFGLAAIDLLAQMYREEMDRAGRPGWPAEPSAGREEDIPTAILRQNLFGIDIDLIALNLARESLAMKLRQALAPADCNLHQADALFDPLPRHWPRSYDVLATNPPYLSARNLPAARVRRLKAAYPHAWRDGCACFIDRGIDLLKPGARAGFLIAQSILFTGSYEKWRNQIVRQTALETLVHFGAGLFGVGNAGTLQTAALILRRENDESAREGQTFVALRLIAPTDPQAKRRRLARECAGAAGSVHRPEMDARVDRHGQAYSLVRGDHTTTGRRIRLPMGPKEDIEPVATQRSFLMHQHELSHLPRGAWAYWAGAEHRRAFAELRRLGQIASPRQGLATTDNARFVRYWWEVEPAGLASTSAATPGRWVPYAKGGRFRKWHESVRHRVNWEDDGREIKESIVARYPYLNGKWQWVAKNSAWYGRGGITYSYLTSGTFSARRLQPGCVFDVAGSALFPIDEAETLSLLALLNSAPAARLLHVINPTLNFQVGDLAELPVPDVLPASLAELAGRAIDLRRGLDRFDETSRDFQHPMPWADAEAGWTSVVREMCKLEREIDRQAAELYRFEFESAEDRNELPLDRAGLARQWISYAVGIELGRWGEGTSCCFRLRPADPRVLGRLRDRLAAMAGPKASEEIVAAVGGLERFLARDFFPCHVRQYRRRPPLWALGDSTTTHLIRHDCADAAMVSYVLRQAGGSLTRGWNRNVDDGMLVNLAPLAEWVTDPLLGKELAAAAEDMASGRFNWSRTHDRCAVGAGAAG